MDYRKIDNIEFDGIDHEDYPDYSDAFISSADYDGREMTEEELNELNENRDFVYNTLMDRIY